MSNIIVTIDHAVKDKLDAYIHIADGEISGLGTVVQPNRGTFHIQDIHLFEQTCTGASTDISVEDVSKSLVQAVTQGLNPETLKLWWHSHANMQAFWSGTDHATAKALDNGSNQWMLCLVQNKRGEYKLRLDVYDPTYVYIDDIDLKVIKPANPLVEQLRAEVNAKVKKQQVPKAQNEILTFSSGNHSISDFYDKREDRHAPGYWDKEKTVWNPQIREWEYPPGHSLEHYNKSFTLVGVNEEEITEDEIANMSKEELEWYNSALGSGSLYPSEWSKLSKRQIKKLKKKLRLP